MCLFHTHIRILDYHTFGLPLHWVTDHYLFFTFTEHALGHTLFLYLPPFSFCSLHCILFCYLFLCSMVTGIAFVHHHVLHACHLAPVPFHFPHVLHLCQPATCHLPSVCHLMSSMHFNFTHLPQFPVTFTCSLHVLYHHSPPFTTHLHTLPLVPTPPVLPPAIVLLPPPCSTHHTFGPHPYRCTTILYFVLPFPSTFPFHSSTIHCSELFRVYYAPLTGTCAAFRRHCWWFHCRYASTDSSCCIGDNAVSFRCLHFRVRYVRACLVLYRIRLRSTTVPFATWSTCYHFHVCSVHLTTFPLNFYATLLRTLRSLLTLFGYILPLVLSRFVLRHAVIHYRAGRSFHFRIRVPLYAVLCVPCVFMQRSHLPGPFILFTRLPLHSATPPHVHPFLYYYHATHLPITICLCPDVPFTFAPHTCMPTFCCACTIPFHSLHLPTTWPCYHHHPFVPWDCSLYHS